MTPGGDSQLKQTTAKGLLWGGIGSGMVQLLNLFFGIFLARLLTPADYGVIGALTIFSATAGIFSESGFTLAIVNKPEATDRDYNAVFWFNIGAALGLYALLWVLAPLIAHFYHMPQMTALARFLFLGFVFGGISTAPTAYMFRNLKVKQRSMAQIVAIAVSGTAGIACAASGWGYWGIALQTVAYSLTNAIIIWSSCPWRPSFSFSAAALRSMLPFSMKQLVTTLFTHINNNFFSVLLGRFYTMRLTGFYTQGSKWTTMGQATVVGMINSVGQPVMRQASADPVRLRAVFSKLLRFTAFVCFPAMFGLALVANDLITVTVTDKWAESVPVIRVLCIGAAFIPVGLLFANLFNSIGKPGIYMWNTIAQGATQLIAVCITYRFGLLQMLAVYSLINIVWVLVWQRFARRHVGIRLRRVLADIAPYALIAAAVMAVTALATAPLAPMPLLALIAKIALAAALYCLILRQLNSVMFNECMDYIFKRKKTPPSDNAL